jgi:hypothetical protein
LCGAEPCLLHNILGIGHAPGKAQGNGVHTRRMTSIEQAKCLLFPTFEKARREITIRGRQSVVRFSLMVSDAATPKGWVTPFHNLFARPRHSLHQEERMRARAIVVVWLTGAAAGLPAAQSPEAAAFKRPASETEEVALALSALPETLRATAGVHVLGPKGYRRIRESTSGINCLVERSRPDTQEPICWDREGSDTIMPAVSAQAEWRATGLSDEEVKRRLAEGFASGRFRAPRRGGVAYMLSAENYVFNGQRVVRYLPHVMFYAPYATNADIGATGKDPHAPWVLNEGSPHAYIIVVTRHGG